MTTTAGVRQEDPGRPPLCSSSEIQGGSVGLVEPDLTQDLVCWVGRSLQEHAWSSSYAGRSEVRAHANTWAVVNGFAEWSRV